MTSKKPAITLTPAAVARVKALMQKAENPVLGVRVGTDTKGCNGMTYTLDYVTELQKEDIKVEQDGAIVFIHPSATLYIFGSVMDWTKDELEQKFTFQNPNAKGTCGCGESFNV